MKYLKLFEAKVKKTPQELLVEYADDIARVLTIYYSTHTGDICQEIDEIIYSFSPDADDDDFLNFEIDGVVTEDLIKSIVSNHQSAWTRDIEKLLNVYYDCIPYTKLVNPDLKKDIEEIFLEYSDMGTVNVSKTSHFNDDRYEVGIRVKDIFFHMNFQEVFGRIKDLGFENYHVDGVKNGNLENMTISFWRMFDE